MATAGARGSVAKATGAGGAVGSASHGPWLSDMVHVAGDGWHISDVQLGVCPMCVPQEWHWRSTGLRGGFEARSKKGCITSWGVSHSKTLIQPKAQGTAKPASHMLPGWGSGDVSLAGGPILPHRHEGSGPQNGSSVILVSPGTSIIWVLLSPPRHPALLDPSPSLPCPQGEVWLVCRQVA